MVLNTLFVLNQRRYEEANEWERVGRVRMMRQQEDERIGPVAEIRVGMGGLMLRKR